MVGDCSAPWGYATRVRRVLGASVAAIAVLGGCQFADRGERDASRPSVSPGSTASGTSSTPSATSSGLAQRRKEVASKGSLVMPFDLTRTRHVFIDRPNGGVQTVTALDPRDRRNISLIHHHLREEVKRFKRGDFGDPAEIHGADMPGLEELRQGAQRIKIRYEQLPDGGRIHYVTDDPALVRGVHTWFRAQSMDHDAEHRGH